MKKKIILLFVAIVHTINSMDQQNILTSISTHPDLLWKLTEQLCVITKRHENKTTYFRNLTLTNKRFCSYYTDEKNQQKIIEFLNNDPKYGLDCRYKDSLSAACFLQFYKIAEKIENIHEKAAGRKMFFRSKKIHQKLEKQVKDSQENRNFCFADEDLAEENRWYLNSTSYDQKYLWNHIIETHNTSKARLLISKSYIKIPSYAFEKIIDNIRKNGYCKEFLDIVEMLLTRIKPDIRNRCSQDTELMMAARNGQKEIAKLLLQKGANPYLLLYYLSDKSYSIYDTYDHIKKIPSDSGLGNAFTFEEGEPKGWLMQMYKEVQDANIKNNV